MDIGTVALPPAIAGLTQLDAALKTAMRLPSDVEQSAKGLDAIRKKLLGSNDPLASAEHKAAGSEARSPKLAIGSTVCGPTTRPRHALRTRHPAAILVRLLPDLMPTPGACAAGHHQPEHIESDQRQGRIKRPQIVAAISSEVKTLVNNLIGAMGGGFGGASHGDSGFDGRAMPIIPIMLAGPATGRRPQTLASGLLAFAAVCYSASGAKAMRGHL